MVLDLVKVKLKVNSSEEVIKILGEMLLESGYVTDTYIDAVLQRELSLPTGLQIGRINVAIPHTDSTHVKESTIALATLEEPVSFQLMADPAQEVDVKLVFLLAVKEPKKQVKLLKQLMAIFQNEELLNRMEKAEDSRVISAILSNALA
ncbi:PTS fructose transporter subunit IIA [Niallia circulans]|uniref:PTS sugar transporter subunit IIA n=1 Tax=Niallia circulans TaxID=1397 RepID=UPI000BA7162C|nr:PTS sugar transporter subunit IIA [Niallia circulans]PAD25163.1 PTS fructose transporter subunit IIA [Niallia circulans]PAD87899.1 PTS fructose transporter subunit IIA [Niallia circulans]